MSMLTLREQGQTPEILGLSAPGSSLPSSSYFAYAHRVSMTATSKHTSKLEMGFQHLKKTLLDPTSKCGYSFD